MPQHACAIGCAKAKMVDGVEREEGLNGVVAYKPEKDRQKQAHGALVGILPDFFEAGEHVGLLFGCFEIFGFFDEDEDQQRRKNHQPRSHPKGIGWIYGIELTTDQEGDNGADAAHKVDDAIGL